ncbi:MAG TPA: ABC transporter ATP-binding protein [Pyrinomonadaceae bacterium]|jgi:ABC-type polysaccharide/polyol phosphate transport system ATPase subunit|nr:ABC transporter ATP-binding protein [Pyrinomonadaceae bacterium]
MTVALRVEKVSKQYRIYERPGDRLKESLTRGILRRHKEFWALRDVDFQIESGTTVGIVGPNGCGKSTLLQIISGTLAPTHGDVWHEGRIAALLELGAGFDPEFTGVENVYMNASLLGLTRRETDALFPAIERFAEIGPFLYQPVKTYSSGMYVRLAFAIAASVEPDILIIDEALAVGDAVFQHRCLRRINELHERGATVLFVSHDAAAVRALCSRAILLRAGSVIADGKPADVLNLYQKIIMEREQAYEAESGAANPASPRPDETLAPLSFAYRHGDGSAEIVGAELTDDNGARVEIVESGETLTLRLVVRFHQHVDDPVIGFLIRNSHGIHAYGTNTKEQQISFGALESGEVVDVSFAFRCWLGVDQYTISLAVHSREGQAYDWLDAALFLRVTSVTLTEGIANLNASVTVRQRAISPEALKRESVGVTPNRETATYG